MSRIDLGLDEDDVPEGGERRESNVSAISTATERAKGPRPTPIAGLDVSVDEAMSTHTNEVEELEDEQQGDKDENDLEEEFQHAVRLEDEARERYDISRRDTITA